MVPDCSALQRKLDKTSILEMTVHYMRIHNGMELFFDLTCNLANKCGQVLCYVRNILWQVLCACGLYMYCS